MLTGHKLSILSNVSESSLIGDPFPHMIIPNALDPELFAALEAQFPAEDVVVNSTGPVKDTWYQYPACEVIRDQRITQLWRDFFAYHVSPQFYLELVKLFGGLIRQTHPQLEARMGKQLEHFQVGMRPGGWRNPLAPGADISMECQFYLNYTRKPRTVRGPHIDAPTELFAALLYFRQPHDNSTGGSLEICRGTDRSLYPSPDTVSIDGLPAEISPARVQKTTTVTYAANTLVLFINSPRSVHAVSPRSPTDVTRRHINFCGDLTLDLFQMRLPPRLKLRRRLEQTPVAWRLARWL